MPPVSGPSQLVADLDGPLSVVTVQLAPRREMFPVGSGGEQVDVWPHVSGSEAPRQERPRVGAADVIESSRGWPGHPCVNIAEPCEEPFQSEQSQSPAAMRARQPVDVVAIAGGEIGEARALSGVRQRHGCLAFAYSAAIVAGERCT